MCLTVNAWDLRALIFVISTFYSHGMETSHLCLHQSLWSQTWCRKIRIIWIDNLHGKREYRGIEKALNKGFSELWIYRCAATHLEGQAEGLSQWEWGRFAVVSNPDRLSRSQRPHFPEPSWLNDTGVFQEAGCSTALSASAVPVKRRHISTINAKHRCLSMLTSRS